MGKNVVYKILFREKSNIIPNYGKVFINYIMKLHKNYDMGIFIKGRTK